MSAAITLLGSTVDSYTFTENYPCVVVLFNFWGGRTPSLYCNGIAVASPSAVTWANCASNGQDEFHTYVYILKNVKKGDALTYTTPYNLNRYGMTIYGIK